MGRKFVMRQWIGQYSVGPVTHMHGVEVGPGIISSVALSFRFGDRCKMFAYADKQWAHDSSLSLLLASGVRRNCERDFCLILSPPSVSIRA